MIAKYYGRCYSLQNLRERSFITRQGVSMFGISDAAESIGMRTQGVRINLQQLIEDVPLPCILHWNQNHFVVLYDIKKKGKSSFGTTGDYTFCISDPAKGKYPIDKVGFEKCWISTRDEGKEVGFALLLTPTPEFHECIDDREQQKKNLSFYLQYLFPYKSQLFQLVVGMLLGSVFSLILPFLTQAMVDQGIGKADNVVICVPSGNFGNITAGLFGKKMGLPVKRFIAANNRNDIFYQYLQTGKYNPRPSVATIANAMDVGNPSNFARVLDLYQGSHAAISAEISGTTDTDEQIRETVKETWKEHHYLLDPHGACGYRALAEGLQQGETGVFLETAHPAKFLETVEGIIGETVEIPAKLQEFMKGEKKSIPMTKDFADFKKYLLSL